MKVSLYKWSLARNQNVNTVYRIFADRENIEYLDDSRGFRLVLLREDLFDKLTTNREVFNEKDEIISLQAKVIRMLEKNKDAIEVRNACK